MAPKPAIDTASLVSVVLTMQTDPVDHAVRARLAEEYLLAVVGLGLQALELVDPPEQGRTLRQIEALREAVDGVEVAAVGLMTGSGTTWESLAADVMVRRQSLHRRLSRKVNRWTHEKAPPELAGSRSREWEVRASVLADRVKELTTTPIQTAGQRVARALESLPRAAP